LVTVHTDLETDLEDPHFKIPTPLPAAKSGKRNTSSITISKQDIKYSRFIFTELQNSNDSRKSLQRWIENMNSNTFDMAVNGSNMTSSRDAYPYRQNPLESIHVGIDPNIIKHILTPERRKILDYKSRRVDIKKILDVLFYSSVRTDLYYEILDRKEVKAKKILSTYYHQKIRVEKVYPTKVEAFILYMNALEILPSQSPELVPDEDFIRRITEIIYRQWMIICLSPFGLGNVKNLDFYSVTLQLLSLARTGGRTFDQYTIIHGDPYVETYLSTPAEIETFGFRKGQLTVGNHTITKTYASLTENSIVPFTS
jgi:hypothetical protein